LIGVVVGKSRSVIGLRLRVITGQGLAAAGGRAASIAKGAADGGLATPVIY